MPATNDEIEKFCRENCIPRGYKYTLVSISITKRMLTQEIPAEYRLKFLEHLDKRAAGDAWLTADMIAAIEPMCDKGDELVCEARKLGPSKALDVYADHFSTFAVLNPSLIAALEMSPGHRARMGASVSPLGSMPPHPVG